MVNGELGEVLCELLRGVCQGSVIGTLLFLAFINDLPNCVQWLLSLLFADDNQVYAEADNYITLANKINAEIKNLVEWYLTNKVPVHPLKTSLTFFAPNFSSEKFKIPLKEDGTFGLDIFLDYNIDPNVPYDISKKYPVNVTNLDKNCDGSVKILGVYLDPCLNFKYQTTNSK